MPKHLNSADDFEMVPIGRLKTHPRNVNESDLGAVIESIKAHGFYGALVAQRGTSFICAGNHRFLAARQLGFDTLPVTWIDCDDETALRVMIADNATTRRGHDNPAALAELLAELAATETGLGAGLGYDGDDLDSLLNDLAGMPQSAGGVNDPNAEWEGMPEFNQPENPAFRTLIVHFDSPQSVADFAVKINQDFSAEAKYINYPWRERQRSGTFVAES